MSTKITKHFFEYGARKYFRGKAENVEMCSYGQKKDPIGANAYLAIQANVKREHLEGRVKFATRTQIDWSKQSETAVNVNGRLKYFGLNADAAVSGNYSKAKKAKLDLVKFYINERPLQTMLNNGATGARKYLAEEGKDGRIVSEIWVLMEGVLAEHFEAATSIKASVSKSKNELELTATVRNSGSQTITISPGTTFAYAMHKVKKWNRGKTRIEDMEDDYKGLG